MRAKHLSNVYLVDSGAQYSGSVPCTFGVPERGRNSPPKKTLASRAKDIDMQKETPWLMAHGVAPLSYTRSRLLCSVPFRFAPFRCTLRSLPSCLLPFRSIPLYSISQNKRMMTAMEQKDYYYTHLPIHNKNKQATTAVSTTEAHKRKPESRSWISSYTIVRKEN